MTVRTPNLGSEKQLAFIKTLAAQRTGWEDLGLADEVRGIVDQDANFAWYIIREIIDTLKECPYRPREDSPQAAEQVGPGYYAKDGVAYQVVLNKAGTRTYAKEFDAESGRWVYARGIIKSLREEHKTGIVELATEYGKETGTCMICCRELTNPESIDRGIGPICLGRVGG